MLQPNTAILKVEPWGFLLGQAAHQFERRTIPQEERAEILLATGAEANQGVQPRPVDSGRDTNCAREKGDAPISAYSAANKSRQETFLRPASVPPSPGSDETLGCLSQ